MNPYLRSKGANKHEFFKRLKDKLIGNPTEEEKVETTGDEQSADLQLEDTAEPALLETTNLEVEVEVEEKLEESPSEDIPVLEASDIAEEEKQEEVLEIAVVEQEVPEKNLLLGPLHKSLKLVLKKHEIHLLQRSMI